MLNEQARRLRTAKASDAMGRFADRVFAGECARLRIDPTIAVRAPLLFLTVDDAPRVLADIAARKAARRESAGDICGNE